jgi:HEPN domain-containing protein
MAEKKYDRTEQLNGFFNQAGERIRQARELRQRGRHAAAVQDCQEAIEFLAKCVFLARGWEYPPEHHIPEDRFLTAITGLPEQAARLNLRRLYLLHRFWFEFYSTAKYGLEKLAAPAENLFQHTESDLALAHAMECQTMVIQLRSIIEQN